MKKAKQRLSNRWLMILILWIPLVFTMVFAFLAYQSQHFRDESSRWILHTMEVKAGLQQLDSLLKDVETNQRAYLLTADPDYLAPRDKALKAIPDQIHGLSGLIADNSPQVTALEHLESLIQNRLLLADQAVSLARQGDLSGASQIVKSGQGKQVMDDIRGQMDAMEQEEDRLLVLRRQAFISQVETQNRLMMALIFAGMVLIAGVTLLTGRVQQMRTKAEQEMETARQAAETSNRLKSQFLANMSHEIRTPLNGVIGTVELMFTTPLNREQREFLETIHTSGNNLLTIINDVLDYSKIEFDKLELDFHPFNLLDLINEVVSMLSYPAIAKDLNIVYLVDYNLRIHYEGDAMRIRQVLVNLVSNAIKFTEKGEVTIEVCEMPRQPRDTGDIHRLVFRVSDTGIGIPAERLDRLFKVFSQVDASTTRKYGGSGLGLVICQKLVEIMGGEISVESALGQGTAFTFDLPLKAGEDDGSTFSDDSEFAGKRILIVDDMGNNRQMLKSLLTRWGVETVEAPRAQQALTLLGSEGKPFDAALIDFHLPDMNGVGLSREIKLSKAARQIPLILISSQAGNVSSAELREAGIVGILTKPIRQNLLRTMLLELFTKGVLPDPGATMALPAIPEAGPPKDLKILITDDNELNHRVTNYLLKRLGYKADHAQNGLEAIAALERKAYDVILMDVQMPNMDGLEATRRIRQKFPQGSRPRIIALTANALTGEREKCLEAGMDDYISKPIKLEPLKEALENSAPTLEQDLV
jgi:signal transduction histidine kinase/DNA-binding response OmpR family regulator